MDAQRTEPRRRHRRGLAHHRRVGLAARILPLVAIGCWIITIFVPVLDSGEPDSMRIRITSLGQTPIDMYGLSAEHIVLWIVIIAVSAAAWLFRAAKWWSVTAIVLGALLSLHLVQMLIDPPYLLWDGMTADGVPTGGMEVAYPAPGFAFWMVGSLSFVAAGICGLASAVGRTPRRRAEKRTGPPEHRL